MIIFKLIKTALTSIYMIGLSVFSLLFNNFEFPKEKIINTYNSIIQDLGKLSLTEDKELKGKRVFGKDNYVGTYSAKYDGYTGNETLFGGTALSRKLGDKIDIKIKVKKESGDIKVINKIGENDITVLENTGEYSNSVYIEGGSYYLQVKLNNFKGEIKVEIN